MRLPQTKRASTIGLPNLRKLADSIPNLFLVLKSTHLQSVITDGNDEQAPRLEVSSHYTFARVRCR